LSAAFPGEVSLVKNTHADLATLRVLETISHALETAGEPLTATRLKRDHSIKDAVFDDAAKFGCDNKYLKWGSRNYYALLRPYTIQEESYYSVVSDVVCALWIKEKYDPSQFYLENTSRKDSKIVGPWVRPDFTLVSHKKFPWTIGYEFDVVTFEVKRPDSANVLAVFEALSHATAATRANVVFPMSLAEWEAADPEQATRVRDECSRHGIGMILVDDVLGSPMPIHLIRARRREIDHEKCSAFLEAVLSAEGKNKISEWK
jgi:hypothetical protein